MRTLRSRIALAYAALVVTVIAVVAVVLVGQEERRYRDALDQRLLAEARLAAVAVQDALRSGSGVEILDPLVKRMGEAEGARITIIGADGGVLGDSENDPRQLDNHGSRPEVLEALASGSGRVSRRSDTEGRDLRYVAVPVRDGDRLLGVVRAATPLSDVNADRRTILLSVTAIAVVAAVAAGLLAVLVAGTVTQPLERLRRAARALAAGSFGERVPAGGSTELSDLSDAFNEMSSRLHETVESLAEERSRLEALLAASADPLAAIDREETIRYLNPAAAALFGGANGRLFAEVARNYQLHDLLRGALATGARASGSVELRLMGEGLGSRALDAPHVFQASFSPIAHGGDWAVLMILQDITESRRAEITRRDFVANVSHELRTPLSGIKAVVETLRDGAMEDPVAADEFLGRVDAEVDRLVHLVEELLQLARIESGMAPMDLTDVAPAEMLAVSVERFRHMAERANVALALDVPTNVPHIRADPDRLGQAVGNLVHNAIKFTPSGGRVTVGACCQDGQVRISVTDTGSGIDPADLPRIFERFYITDRARSGKGTGLGLAIVKHVVRAHGGTVEAQSVLGRGSTFTITLPVEEGSGEDLNHTGTKAQRRTKSEMRVST